MTDTIVNSYPKPLTGPSLATRPVIEWESGVSPNRRWVPDKLPTSGAIASWADTVASSLLAQGSVAPTVGTEAGVKHAAFSGAEGAQLILTGLSEPELRTIVVIARPNTGDAYFGSATQSPIFSTNSHTVFQGAALDAVGMVGATVGAGLPALRNRWHVYAMSIAGPSGAGVLVVDNSDTTFTASATAQNQLRIARASSANHRQLRVLEVFTSASTFTAAQLKAIYPKAKAWYPGLAW